MPLAPLLRLFFRWLYHPLAFAYDVVAATVSLGHWNEWVRVVLPFVQGMRLLELGHGPGHLQLSLRGAGRLVIGLDESRQMGRIAARRLRTEGGDAALTLVRGVSQALPFPNQSFDSLVSTFPSEYIFDPQTLSEARRVLAPGGRLIVLPAAWPNNRFLAWVFKVTGEAPSEALEVIKKRILPPFQKAGFQMELQTLQVESGVVMVLTAARNEE